jgi:crotonobetainyl-CoA:carnitine CoA-transferase CaiB-like acyl-CoA transferase
MSDAPLTGLRVIVIAEIGHGPFSGEITRLES